MTRAQPKSTSTSNPKLAIDGGPKAFTGATGKAENKIGVEEFMSIAERFGFSKDALARLRSAVSDDDLIEGGPNLAYYACPNPRDTKGSEFARLAREIFGVKYALPTSSGTAALHAAMVATGVGPGTEVIIPACGFMATSAAAAIAGGVPVFADVDESLQLDPNAIESRLTPRTVAIAPTHHWGNVADMDPIMAVARKHKLKVIEDCAQAPGAKYKGRYVGSIGDLGCFSISCYKIIGGGEGGMVVTSNERLFERACQLAECGGLWRPDRFAPPRYEGELFVGTNYRLSELESSVNVIQMQKLDGICDRTRAVRKRICSQLKSFKEITPQKINDRDGAIGYLMRFYPKTHELSAKIVAALRAEGIGGGTQGPSPSPDWHLYTAMFPVIHKVGAIANGSPFDDPRYAARGGKVEYREGDCPVAEDLYNRAVRIGIDQWWSNEDCDAIAAGINKVLSAYCTEGTASREWA